MLRYIVLNIKTDLYTIQYGLGTLSSKLDACLGGVVSAHPYQLKTIQT